MSKALLSYVRGFALALGVLVALALPPAGALVVLVPSSVALASSNCSNEALRVGPSANLPDCRAYELVSPPDKNGGQVEGGFNFSGTSEQLRSGMPYQAALDGEAVTYGSAAVFDESEATAGVLADQYLSTRTTEGWRTQEIVPEYDYPEARLDVSAGAVDYSLYQGFSEDLSHAFLLSYEPPLVTGAPTGYYNPYMRNNLTGSYTLLNTVKPPVQSPGKANCCEGFVSQFAGFSADYKHVIFEANDALTPGAIPGGDNLYEWSEGEGLELVSILPGGMAVQALGFGTYRGVEQFYASNFVHSISADGARAFWTGPGEVVYMHERTGAGARTVQISAGPATLVAASVDGSLAYLLEQGGLYQYSVSTNETIDIAPGAESVFGISDDGSYVYYESPAGLYLWHDGTVTLVAHSGNTGYGVAFGPEFRRDAYGSARAAEFRTSRVTPNGQALVFDSSEAYTDYSNVNSSACPERELEGVHANPGNRCNEVYEYNANTNKLVCISCNQTGVPPVGDSFTPGEYHTDESVPGWESPTMQQRYVNAEGTRVFFDSEDELVPQASNHRVNVYEYEWPGVGSCESAGGCIYLISSGVSSENSWFVDASASGSDVFFLTSQQLVGQDGDEALDVYDARVNGGFPYGSPPPCGGEACRPSVTSAPQIYTAPSSETFEGAGNFTPGPVSESTTVKQKTIKKQSKKRGKAGKKRRRRGKAGSSIGHSRKGGK